MTPLFFYKKQLPTHLLIFRFLNPRVLFIIIIFLPKECTLVHPWISFSGDPLYIFKCLYFIFTLQEYFCWLENCTSVVTNFHPFKCVNISLLLSSFISFSLVSRHKDILILVTAFLIAKFQKFFSLYWKFFSKIFP
jgi:hypothetical protein